MGWNESFWNGFLVAGCLKYALSLNSIWLINSLAHSGWGDHPYDWSDSSTENMFISIFTLGEGWHNWHHKYPFDYAASEFGISSQFNPSKLFIDCMAALGLVWDRKRGTSAWTMGRARRDR